ncbi:hypothetical protein LTR36_004887 [Oleoguttula mirabilis]|uniref:Uncharacterized protein n=1 Tax=Oleoguttula mirabilis TaxID=1507867 RepID=A0AAV9JF26_9PEZI|nr:hypothetical protein LTR36_004887 [Oleoguttula mirabilis]
MAKKLQNLRKSPSTSSTATVIIRRPKTSQATTKTKPKNKYSVTREASTPLSTSISSTLKSKMCNKPKPKPRELELLVDAHSAVAKNLENPKARYLMGISEVVRVEMAPSVRLKCAREWLLGGLC